MTDARPFPIGQTIFRESFSTLQDPRRISKGNYLYSLEEILFLTIAATIAGCKAWTTIAEYGRIKIDWFRKYYPYKKMPSHDAISDLFCVLDPVSFSSCFLGWANSIASKSGSGIIAIDGKTIKGTASQGQKFPIHIVTAFCVNNSISLGQRAVTGKSNEISAIPELLQLLMIQGAWVTIDAMGCQKQIAATIKGKGAEYILAVKDNQKFLHDDIKEAFSQSKAAGINEQANIGHGRIEKRVCRIVTDTQWVCKQQEWEGLQTLIEITSERTIKATGEKQVQVRHYISSAAASAEKFNQAIRSHWAIENNLHWNLDVIFTEDGQLKRKGNSAQNFNTISKAALALVENEKTIKQTKPLKMLKAAHDDNYRELILKI
jgi:predicted transposase YbfD/YdcC